MDLKTASTLFKTHKEKTLFGRYIHHQTIGHLLDALSKEMTVELIGKSVNDLPIHSIVFGTGRKKILMWSQMHGNESTTTKAVFDLLNVILVRHASVQSILESCTVMIIPILNPDGAKAYTRLNANNVDLNRDAQNVSQPESLVLKSVFDQFKPNYCFNLHGQRTIFSAGDTNNSATMSFLSPSQDEDKTATYTRSVAMDIIVTMYNALQSQLKNQVGIYDDGFNINCVGDSFQSKNVPTVLFEAGHYQQDYHRERTREFVFQSLLVGLTYIAENDIKGQYQDAYFKIPKNQKRFYDIIIRNANGLDIAIQYEEILNGEQVEFQPKVKNISDSIDFFAHREIDARGHEVLSMNGDVITASSEIVFVMINNEKFSLKP
ncbi:MAG: DUF2817 domain-containing protein [Algicola sp.]|nr:DUF2817 domain-containing protein [Algicola sp.]